VSHSANYSSVTVGQLLTLSGTVTPSGSGSVQVQQDVNGSWQTDTVLATSNGAFSATFDPEVGTFTAQAVGVGSPGHLTGTSLPVSVTVLAAPTVGPTPPDTDPDPYSDHSASHVRSVHEQLPPEGPLHHIREGAHGGVRSGGHDRSLLYREHQALGSERRRARRNRLSDPENVTPGHRIPVTVKVSLNGRSGQCSTSFTPRR
jgi:hypothetical protein